MLQRVLVKRHLILPSRGTLVINTDVHGNDEDMARLEEIFVAERAREPETHWVILGDIVHAPSDDARIHRPELYDFLDGTMQIVDRLLRLMSDHTGHVHFVLGNHDHGHVGGPHTQKFHADEVTALEAALTIEERMRLQSLLEPALLAVVAPCGVLLTHGAPDVSLEAVHMLDDVPLDIGAMTPAQRTMMRSLLTSYGQTNEAARTMLTNVSRSLPFDVGVLIHGHDRDEQGFFREGEHQLCPCIFGAPRGNKRYVRLDLSARYGDAHAIREDFEILHLYAAG